MSSRSTLLLTAGAIALSAGSAVVTTRSAIADGTFVVGNAAHRQVGASSAGSAAGPIAIQMPDPSMLPLVGAAGVLLMRRRRT